MRKYRYNESRLSQIAKYQATGILTRHVTVLVARDRIISQGDGHIGKGRQSHFQSPNKW